MIFLISLDLSAVRAHPRDRDKPATLSFVKSLHLDRVILVLAELVLDVWHKVVYIFKTEKPFYGPGLAHLSVLNYRGLPISLYKSKFFHDSMPRLQDQHWM